MSQGYVLTILNLKGGVGKTHATWLLASVAHERSLPLLAIDLDTQGNLTTSFATEERSERGVAALFHPAADDDPATLTQKTPFACIDLIPSSPKLARFDLSDQKVWEKTDSHLALLDAAKSLRNRYKLIIFDLPPRLSLVSFAALCASDFVIIPMEAADWGAQGIVQVTEAIEYVRQRFNPGLELLGNLVSRFKKRRSYQQSYLKQLRKHFGDKAFDTVIPDLAEFEKSVTDRIPITLHARRSEEAGIARRFFDEVERRIERHTGDRRSVGHARVHEEIAAAA